MWRGGTHGIALVFLVTALLDACAGNDSGGAAAGTGGGTDAAAGGAGGGIGGVGTGGASGGMGGAVGGVGGVGGSAGSIASGGQAGNPPTTVAVSGPVMVSTFAQMTVGSLAGSQLDGPLLIYPGGGYSLGTHWNCGQPAGGLSQVLMTGSLDNPYSSVAWVKPTCVYGSNGYCQDAPSGTYPAFTTFAPNLTNVNSLWFVDSYWPAPGVTAEVLAFIHEESIDLVVDNMAIGLAYSSDSGNTWRYLGRIITRTNAAAGNIQGAPYIVNNGYFYLYYDEPAGTAVARANVNDVIAAAQNGSMGSGLWHKYYTGNADPWSEPALGGNATSLSPVGITHTQAVHSSYNGRYYLLTSMHKYQGGPTWLKLYESSDGLSWALSTTLVNEDAADSQQIGGYQYCSLIDETGAANHEVGQKFYVYCMKYEEPPSPTACAASYNQYRWEVSL